MEPASEEMCELKATVAHGCITVFGVTSKQLTLADELHVLRRAHVLAEVDGVEAKHVADRPVVGIATREVVLGATRAGDLPWEKTVGDADDLVPLRTVAVGGAERQHGVVLALGVVLEGQTRVHRICDIVLACRRNREASVLGSAEEARVCASNIAGAHDVARNVHVLRLGDDRLGVAGVVPGKRSR